MEPADHGSRRSRSPSRSPSHSYRSRSPNSRRPDNNNKTKSSRPDESSKGTRKRVGRRSTHKSDGERIGQEGRVAVIPCRYCYEGNMLCLVGARARRCAGCTKVGRSVYACGVDNEQYRYEKSSFP